MRTDNSTDSKIYLVPIVAMLVALVWSLMGEPVTSKAPYPLPAQAVAASPTGVQTN